jgi:hypothetical protein
MNLKINPGSSPGETDMTYRITIIIAFQLLSNQGAGSYATGSGFGIRLINYIVLDRLTFAGLVCIHIWNKNILD